MWMFHVEHNGKEKKMGADRITQGPLNSAGTDPFDTQALLLDAANNVLEISGNAHQRSALRTALAIFQEQTALAWIELANPGTPTGTPGTPGAMAGASYYAKIVAIDAYGNHTNVGTESSAVVVDGATNKSIAWAWTAVTGAVSYQIWVGATGAEGSYFTSATNSYTQLATAGTAGTMPSANVTGTQPQALLSQALNAGVLNVTNRTMRVKGALIYATTSSNVATITLALTLGGISLCSITTAATNTTASTNLPIQFEFVFSVAVVGGASASKIESHGSVKADIGTAAATAIAQYLDTNTAVVTGVNLLAADALAVTIAASAQVPSAKLLFSEIELIA